MNQKEKEKILQIITTIFMLIIGLIIVLPFIWMFLSSFKTLGEINQLPPKILPKSFNLKNYKEVLFNQTPSFWIYIKNSFSTTILATIGTVLTASMAGYAFARLEFKGREFFFLLYLATMMIPFQVLMIPQFIQFKWMGLFNTHLAIILPRIFTPFGTFLMRQYFLTIPKELIEAGRVDGASEFTIFFRLVFPLAKPALTTLTILSFVWRWNDYDSPLIFLTKKALFTIPVGLTTFIDESGMARDHLVMAASTIAVIPMIVVFLIAQKQFIAGLTGGSVKG